MPKLFGNSVESPVNRILEPDAPVTLSEPSVPARPLVYSGTMPATPNTMTSPGIVTPPRNRKIATRKTSTFNIILILFGAAAVIVLYISNIIAVDRLMMEINALQKKHQRMLSEQEILKAEINRSSSLERINRKAEELGLVNPKEPPVWMSVDGEKVRDVEQALQKK